MTLTTTGRSTLTDQPLTVATASDLLACVLLDCNGCGTPTPAGDLEHFTDSRDHGDSDQDLCEGCIDAGLANVPPDAFRRCTSCGDFRHPANLTPVIDGRDHGDDQLLCDRCRPGVWT